MAASGDVEHKEIDGISIVTFSGEIKEFNMDNIFKKKGK